MIDWEPTRRATAYEVLGSTDGQTWQKLYGVMRTSSPPAASVASGRSGSTTWSATRDYLHLPESDALNVLRDCFPGGSVTGAPKLRAMQIIEQLEPDRRGVYCGAIGYVGFDGNMDSNIAIRTLVYSDDEIRCWAGGGIVADSDMAAEYQETLDKASAMLELLRHYGGEYDGATQSE